MEEKNVFYEKLDEYYKLKSKKKPFPKYVQLQMIAEEIEMAKIKTGKKDRRQYYLLSIFLCIEQYRKYTYTCIMIVYETLYIIK
ncbi:unnamed protein product [Macrosiphum euphorbiae]|uniref:Uncharacterized protein n=1 Tax=Macrosiphum euphorbiae TaxID=13131 RepID=A0AAV0VYJ2_9HEMI|nr:unnamed protein product [Macrosiphum euphorbiae]